MSLEQSINTLNGTILELIEQLKLGRSAQTGATPPSPAPGKVDAPKPDKAEKSAQSSGGTKSSEAGASAAPASGPASGQAEAAPLNCMTDVAPAFSSLAVKDRPTAVALLAEYQEKNGVRGKLCEVLLPEQCREVLDRVNAALAGV
jgi:hypothetical protein